MSLKHDAPHLKNTHANPPTEYEVVLDLPFLVTGK